MTTAENPTAPPTAASHLLGLRKRRAATSTLRLLTVATAVVGATAAPASASIPDVPERTWMVNGRVWAIVQVGRIVYVGGDFTAVKSRSGIMRRRRNLAAFNAATGVATSWRANTNGPVYTLTASADETRLYAGGAFTKVRGATRLHAAAFNTAGGSLNKAWKPRVNAGVRALKAVSGARIYMGGSFTRVDGRSRYRLAKLDTATGRVLSWVPRANGTVRAIAFLRGTVYVGGHFEIVNGRSSKYLAALSETTGGLRSWGSHPPCSVWDLAATGTNLYAVCFNRRPGRWEGFIAYNTRTGGVRFSDRADGGVQTVTVLEDKIYAGGHFLRFGGAYHRKLVRINIGTRKIDRGWRANTNSGPGVFAARGYRNHLYIGGDFTRVTGVRQEHFAQFTDRS